MLWVIENLFFFLKIFKFVIIFSAFAVQLLLMTSAVNFGHVVYLQNYPLFLKTASSEKDMTFYYTVYTSLDVVEEKISSVAKSNNDLRELYLGLLYPMEDYKVYPLLSAVP